MQRLSFLLYAQSILSGDSSSTRMSSQLLCAEKESIPSTAAAGKSKKRILMIRHGRSLGNDMMSKPGNEWGDPNFTDDASLVDSPLSKEGIAQAQALAKRLGGGDNGLKDLDAIIVSPLTRTIQTMQYGVLPLIEGLEIPIIAQPLATERVYTASDTGRSKAVLQRDFAGISSIDFSLLPDNDEAWCFHTDTPGKEWRPCDAQQYYAVPGEPEIAFEQRMKDFESYLASLPYTTICLVIHWGVLRHLIGRNFENCEAEWVEWDGVAVDNKKE